MAFLTEEKFRFVSEALSADTFGVVEFKGEEGLSMPYRFEILLVSSEPEIDIPSVVQYRPLRATPRPTISGSLNGKIDAAGSGEYAELDENGRYKVILPFDLCPGVARAGRRPGCAWRSPMPVKHTGCTFPCTKTPRCCCPLSRATLIAP